jgi:hypothetical protein
MPFLKEQIDLINAALKPKVWDNVRYVNGMIGGLAFLATRQSDGSGLERFPVLMDETGEVKSVALDDTFNVTAYHRLMGTTYRNEVAKASYGDGIDFSHEVNTIKLVVFGNYSALKKTPDEVVSDIVKAMPSEFSAASIAPYSLDAMLVTVTASETDSLVVFGSEYVGMQYAVPPEDFMISITYTIDTRSRKNCVPCSPC